MHKYEAKIYSNKTGAMYAFYEQPRYHLDKQFINCIMGDADFYVNCDDPVLLVIIWRDGDPVLFGSVRSWVDGSTVHAHRSVSRWENRSRVEWERWYNLAE